MQRAHFVLGLFSLATAVGAQDVDSAALAAWLATDPMARTALPGGEALRTRAECEEWLPKLIDAAKFAARQRSRARWPMLATDASTAETGHLQLGDATMPFVWLRKGEKPARGFPLWICLHGGGGNADAEGPHAWAVNTKEWAAQKSLFARAYEAPGLYFIPRMADDRKGRWWFDHNQRAIDEVIREAVLLHEVDPDRVYLMGISEGGYGAIRFAGNRPDRFAACGGMAAAEPLTTSPPENMRNVAMRIDIGERDTMYDRIGLARRMGERLAELKATDTAGYDFLVHVQEGRGHGIDYTLSPKWLASKVRDPRPSRVVWTVVPFDTTVDLHCYWLALTTQPARLPLHLTAAIHGNRIHITAEHDGPVDLGKSTPTLATEGSVLVRLDDAMVDLDQPIEIVVNGTAREPRRVTRTLATLARTYAERFDPHFAFPVEITIELAGT